MTDEITTEEVTTETPEQTPEAAPALTDDQIAAALGVEPDYLAEVKGQIKDLNGFYAKVNKRNMQLVEQQKQLEARASTPASAPAAAEDDIELDEKSAEVLRKFIQREFSPLINTVQQQNVEAAQSVIEDFAKQNPNAPHTRIDEIMDELGLWELSDTPAKLKKNLNRALKLAKADSFDPEAEAAEIAAKKLQAVTEDGSEVVEVKKKRGSVPATRSEDEILADPNIDFFTKMAMLNKAAEAS